jgi:hypothetical protein
MCGPDTTKRKTSCIEHKTSTRNKNPLSALALHAIYNYHEYGPKNETTDFIKTFKKG